MDLRLSDRLLPRSTDSFEREGDEVDQQYHPFLGRINADMSDDKVPSWLDVNNDSLGAKNGSADNKTSKPAAIAHPTESNYDVDQASELPGVIFFLRVLNFGASIGVIIATIFHTTQFPNPADFVLALYGTCAGLLICCLETQLQFLRVSIAVNFGFLFHSGFRFLYYLLIALILLSFNRIYGYIMAGVMVFTAAYNTYVLIKYPEYKKMREKLAEEEDKRIQEKIKNQVKNQAKQAVINEIQKA